MLGIRAICNIATTSKSLLINQTRNTFILRRRWPPSLHKKHGKPSKLRGRHFVYDLVEDTEVVKKPDMKIILNQFVEGVGESGDVLTLSPAKAYKNFLVPGLAVYATPENIAKYKVDENKPKVKSNFSSPYVQRTMGCLSRLLLQISMSKTQPWTLEPWHVRTSFRKAGFVVPEDTITLPPVKISGPDLSLQEKEFYVTVKINNKEEVNVRCRIHHWATGLEKLPWVEFHWKKPCDPLIPEQAAELAKIPLV
ncbi:PREDICTED: 39S ribosomal protein L9, mitochondrial [Papilio polytes]|uniref:39S ribosomal protein L9, mitochondrial n=1 Tax=Papilio polytes TaxID=76194 RepID=UPI000675C7DC|nr:PREDICTED: 39S ribosomal protein L9, mitochondrial [Papilio polytes]